MAGSREDRRSRRSSSKDNSDHRRRHRDERRRSPDMSSSGHGLRYRDSSHHRSRSPSSRRDRDFENEVEEGQCSDQEYYEDRIDHRQEEQEIPNKTIMLRGLGPQSDENDILAILSHDCFTAKDIRLMRNRDTGVSRGFAFVEFDRLEDAVRWRQLTQGVLTIDGVRVHMHYSQSRDSVRDSQLKMDWTCSTCGLNNFKRRDECFKCGTSRRESDGLYGGDEISIVPTNCLILRNVSLSCTSDMVLSFIGSLFNPAIKSIRFANSNPVNPCQRSCFVELHTIMDATTLMNLMANADTSMLSSSSPLIVNYCRRSASAIPVAVASNAASAALAAAQWTNQSENSQPLVSTVTVNGVAYQKFPTPDPSLFQLEPTSGFLYDHTTRLYFDPKSKYYFNSVTQKYLYWSPKFETYLPVEAQETTRPTASVVAQEVSSGKRDRKPETKDKTNKNFATEPVSWKSFEQKASSSRSVDTTSSKIELDLVDKSTDESSPEPEEDPKDILDREEKRLLDFDKLLCLLCKRQFTSKDQLTKHQQVSGLHKSNMEVLSKTVLSSAQILLMNAKKPILEYIDRAKERRKKWGDDDAPQPNPEKDKYLRQSAIESAVSLPAQAAPKIDSSNKGNRMLKAMGWTEGQGLGKKNTGRTDIIHIETRSETAGLGMKSSQGSKSIPGESYKDAVKRAMAQRYKELSEQD